MWIKNTDGKPDATLTFAVIAFAVVILNIFLATFGTITILGATITFTAMGAGTITAILGPTLTAYVGRRLTGAMYSGVKLEAPPHASRASVAQRSIEELPTDAIAAVEDYDPTGDR